MTQAVLSEVLDENVLAITLNRPKVSNVIDSAMSLGLRAEIEELDRNPALRVGVLTGAGGSFCAGMDLKAYTRVGKPQGAQQLLREGARKPLIAAIEGAALGGGLELALIADLIVAATDAQLGLPETRVGLFPSGGAIYRLHDVLPKPLVAEMTFTGEPIGAERAHHYGLISRLTPPGETLAEALKLAALISRNAPLGVAACKDLLRRRPDATADDFWLRQRELANAVQVSDDAREGTSAFTEGRVPVWSNQ